MIEKMKYINLTGKLSELDRVIEQYISRYSIQLESAVKILSNTSLNQIQTTESYQPLLQKAEKFLPNTNILPYEGKDMTKEEAITVLENLLKANEDQEFRIHKLEKEKENLLSLIKELDPFKELEFNLETLTKFKYIKFRFGKMPVNSFKQFEAFLYDEPEIIFLSSKNDGEYIWGVYFAPEELASKVDSVFSSLHFERVKLSYETNGSIFAGTPKEVVGQLQYNLIETEKKIKDELQNIKEVNAIERSQALFAYNKLKSFNDLLEIRRFAARTHKNFFIFIGWMGEKDARALEKEIEANEDSVVLMVEEESASVNSRPPTKLKNPFFIKPFELFVNMYGTPSYNEMDPTPLVALTYTILFGIMFGDLGQGFVVALLGLFLFLVKKMPFGSILIEVGISSMFFGFMYGSIFGFEHIIKAYWMHPAENMMTFLMVGLGIGVFLILVSMITNIINAIKQKNIGHLLFSPNGIPGLVFYIALISIGVFVYLEKHTVATVIIILFIVLPLILIAFREPIIKLLERKKRAEKGKLIEGGAALFLLETFIELFEVLLTYFTNTVSFVRVGAFALSHAGMMSVVMLLARNLDGSSNLFVIILGNIMVIALEGLVVGIQVLRLEFYELFSRFYEGGGRAFASYKQILKEKGDIK